MFDSVLSGFGLVNIIAFDLIFFRTLGFFYICPYFREKRIPKKVVIIMSMGISYILCMNDQISTQALSITSLADQVKWGGLNLFVGVLVGMMALFALELIRMTGKIIAYSMQLGFSQMIDPSTGGQGDVIGTTLYFLFSLFFVSSGGIMMLIDMFTYTFTAVPLTEFVIKRTLFLDMAQLFGLTFLYGLLLALPFVACSLLLNVGLGVISKSAPSMNLFALGFPMAILLGIFGMYLTMPVLISDLFIYFIKLKQNYMELIV